MPQPRKNMKMHPALLLFLLFSFLPSGARAEALKCEHIATAQLSGKIRSLGMVQIEPQQSPQFHYDLDLSEPWCGLNTIGFSGPNPVFCANGNNAVLEGELWPPEPPLSIPLFDLREVKSCIAPSEETLEFRASGDDFMYGKNAKPDYTQALYWYRKAAEAGDTQSKAQLGLIFSEGGYGVTRNPDEAAKWFREAAEEGNSTAQVNLAFFYDSRWQGGAGNEARGGIKPDDALAAQWYKKAAEQGALIAQRNLGLCYERGQGVAKNMEEAYFWYSLLYDGAVKEQSPGAIKNAGTYKKEVAAALTMEQIEKIETRVRAWKPAEAQYSRSNN